MTNDNTAPEPRFCFRREITNDPDTALRFLQEHGDAIGSALILSERRLGNRILQLQAEFEEGDTRRALLLDSYIPTLRDITASREALEKIAPTRKPTEAEMARFIQADATMFPGAADLWTEDDL
jgi:hypothetical protein